MRIYALSKIFLGFSVSWHFINAFWGLVKLSCAPKIGAQYTYLIVLVLYYIENFIPQLISLKNNVMFLLCVQTKDRNLKIICPSFVSNIAESPGKTTSFTKIATDIYIKQNRVISTSARHSSV